jgi:hypothetical protein
MNDLFSTLAPVKRKKVELAPAPRRPQREIERADSLELPDFTVDHDEPHVGYRYDGGESESAEFADAPTFTTSNGPLGKEIGEEDSGLVAEEDAQKGQWRVGKRPGHQGSHIRRPEAEELGVEAEKRGQKRSLGQVSLISSTIVGGCELTPYRASPTLPKRSSRSHFASPLV